MNMVKREDLQDNLGRLKAYLTADPNTRAKIIGFQEDVPAIPSHEALEYLGDVKNVWGVHFTRENPEDISRKGFRYGTQDLSRINNTYPRVVSKIRERKPGFNFSYMEGDSVLDTTTPQRQYGSQNDEYRAVAFMNKRGILVKHKIENENQLIFWGSDVPTEDIFPLVYSLSSRKWHIPLGKNDKIEVGSTIPDALKYIKSNQVELRSRLGKSTKQGSLEAKIMVSAVALFSLGIILQGARLTGFVVNNNYEKSLNYSSLSLILLGFIIIALYYFFRKK